MEPFVAEIRIFGFNFAPQGWATCSGQILPIQQNTALFSLLGTTYGGNGSTTFALPNLQGTTAVSSGQSTTGTNWQLGAQVGTPTVTLLSNQMPAHTHSLMASTTRATGTAAANQQLAYGFKGSLSSSSQARMYSSGAPDTALAPQSLATTGSTQPHNNMMPYLTLNFCIALQGIYPSRP